MKRKTMALMLALSMCLSLLSACGSGNTATDDKPPESENAVSSTEQPEESEEPIQEEPKEENNAGTELLALLQEKKSERNTLKRVPETNSVVQWTMAKQKTVWVETPQKGRVSL